MLISGKTSRLIGDILSTWKSIFVEKLKLNFSKVFGKRSISSRLLFNKKEIDFVVTEVKSIVHRKKNH